MGAGSLYRGFVILAALLFALGGLVAYGNVARTIESEYSVVITAREDLAWNLSIPSPEVPMALDTTGVLRSVNPVESVHGLLHLVAGTGSVTLLYTRSRVALTSGPIAIDGFVNLTGREGLTQIWVWRDTEDESTPIQVRAFDGFRGRHLGGSFECGGIEYSADLAEGWNSLSLGIGDCLVVLDGMPWLEVVAPALFVAGGVASFGALRRGRRPTQG